MDSGRKEYTFFWSIENYSYCWHKNGEVLNSPIFIVDGLKGTCWKLQLYPRGMGCPEEGHISLFLYKSASNYAPIYISVNYELSILDGNGSPLYSQEQDHTFFKRAHGWPSFLKIDEMLLQRKADYLPQDTLTVRCKIWKGEGDIHNIGQSSARTRIKIEKISFLHEVKRFSTLRQCARVTILIPSNSFSLCSSLYFNRFILPGKDLLIKIEQHSTLERLCKLEVYLLDGYGNKVECCKADKRYDTNAESIDVLPLSLTRRVILKKKSEYLPDDKLSLLCECTFAFEKLEFETIEETWHGISRAALKSSKDGDYTVEKISTYPSLLDGIKDLYTNKSLTDVHLKTKTKSFSAHKIVLCARSPVFKAMMTNDMEEKNTDCIKVNDLGDDVLQQLLLFMYSDTIKNLQWEMATQLYYAADKYQIDKLKQICSSFLIENITPTNAGELLLLADTHSDTDLKKLVEDFISENEEQVFCSDEWEVLMESHPLLFIRTMHLKYKRRKLK